MNGRQNRHFVDVVKQEHEDVDYDVNNIIEQDFQFKQEPDVEWNEQNFSLDDLKVKYCISTEPPIHMFHAKVFVERLPESVLEKYVTVEKKYVAVEQRPIYRKEKVTKKKIKRLEKRKFLGTYQKFCPKCNKRISIKEKRSPRICSECEVRLKFECRNCKKQLHDFAGIKIHVIVNCNSTGEHYKCLKCKYVSVSKSDVELHVKRYHKARDVALFMQLRQNTDNRRAKLKVKNGVIRECTTCHQLFPSLCKLLWHMQSCADPKKNTDVREEIDQMCTYSCTDCNETITKFESADELVRLTCNKCGLSLSRICNVCHKAFSSGTSFYVHFKFSHGKTHRGTFVCPNCDFSVSKIKTLITHYKNNHLVGAPRCDNCGKHYSNRASLKQHIIHCGDHQKLQCEHCSFKTSFRAGLLKHLNTVHIVENGIDCSACGRKYKNQGSYNDHFRYCGVKPYLQCDKCPYKTSYKSALKRHTYSMHPDDRITKDFVCSKCGKAFQNDSHRKAHEYTHRKKRLHCNDCFFTSLRWSDLIRHMRTMHLFKKGPGNKECPDCGEIVKTKYHLRLHSRYCLTKPYFECDHCIYKTQKKRELKAHLSSMHSKIYGSETVNNIDNQIDVTS